MQDDSIAQVADALAQAIANLAVLSQPEGVAVQLRKHLGALASECTSDQPCKRAVLDMICGRLDALMM